MTENPEASVLTATRAAQHFRLFSADDAYEHLCILTVLPSLAPLHLMLADTPWPHSFGATLTNVGPLSEGFERSVASPLQPRRLCAMGRTVRSISSLSDNHSNSFQVAVRLADHPGVRGWYVRSQSNSPGSVQKLNYAQREHMAGDTSFVERFTMLYR
jgi:hypothetical protein